LTDFDRELAIFSQMFDLSRSSADTARYFAIARNASHARGAIAALLNAKDGPPASLLGACLQRAAA
jgi:hypothetical protein